VYKKKVDTFKFKLAKTYCVISQLELMMRKYTRSSTDGKLTDPFHWSCRSEEYFNLI
jgi:hypothetical protein